MPIEIAALVTLAMAALADAAEQPRAVAVRQGMTDQELWQLVVTGGDPLRGMSFDQAVREDPRRIDAKIRQLYFQAMHRQLPSDPMSARLDEGLYLMGLQAVRNASGGTAPTLPLLSVHEENWHGVLAGTTRTWPPFVRQTIQRDWQAIASAFDQAGQVAHRAGLSASGQGMIQDAMEWSAFRQTLRDMKEGLKQVLETGEAPALPARVRLRLEERKLLPGPTQQAPTLAQDALDTFQRWGGTHLHHFIIDNDGMRIAGNPHEGRQVFQFPDRSRLRQLVSEEPPGFQGTDAEWDARYTVVVL